MGATVLCWSVCKNAVVFDNKQSSFLQVIYYTTHSLRMWAIQQQPSSQDIRVAASYFLAQVAKDFFPKLMGGSLVVGLTVTSVPGYVKTLFRLCAVAAEAENISS